MSLLMAGGAALAGAAMQQGGNFAQEWMGNSARESLSKNIGRTNLKRQMKYDRFTQQMDMNYENWYQNLMYDLQATKYYDLAERYAKNTASWAVEGLKNAGLNPILAAQNPNMSSNLGDASPTGSGSHGGRGSIPSSSAPSSNHISPISATMLQDLSNSAKQGDLIEAQTNRTIQETENLRKNEGLSGTFGAIANVLENVGMKEPLKRLANVGADWLMRKLGTDDGNNTAKSVQHGADDRMRHSASQNYDSSKDSKFRGVIPDYPDYDKVNAHGLRVDSEKSPQELERERRLRNGRKSSILFYR